ncbi:adenine nucleotide alpha hydrolase family protein [Urbifossiella limnaea]|uniref:7-cyano-7-deazaguanine synthase n=1 Tax=Urbifossiella limnaea TaxID=2528023 RepID=A0A517XQW0_9BACT|nr:hypothetical protein [Urbifossiella limnaea]QDU19879.1 7-cyano-7-deazaguanine synthase [Urbifossiella limnaea]
MATERAIRCGQARGQFTFTDPCPLRLRMWGEGWNVRYVPDDIRSRLYRDPAPEVLDLIDVATYVYAADRMVGRGSPADVRFGPNWRRRLCFRVPVRKPDLWGQPAVRQDLEAVLSFMSEDTYEFEFEHYSDPPAAQRYMVFTGPGADREPDEVVLFSGGLDSVAGAVREVVAERKSVALVGHRPSGAVAPRQAELIRLLSARAAHRPLLLPVRVNIRRGLGRESTQRSRTFLYASLGAAFAAALGRDRLRFYENGITSHNFPLAGSVVGARASRSTHPRVIAGLTRFFTRLIGRSFTVENPFQTFTKTGVVREILAAGCGETIRHTVSCSFPRRQRAGKPHCGVCSQCVDRRFAVLAAGAEAFDPEDGYRVPLVTGERAGAAPRTMLSVYVQTATRVETETPVGFFGRYGEAARSLRYLGAKPDAAAVGVLELYRDHAREVTRVVDAETARHAAALRRGELPPSCLVRLVCDATQAGSDRVAPAPEPPAGENMFRRSGRAWEARFAGGRRFVVLRSVGATYLHHLLSRPDVPIPAAELVCLESGEAGRIGLGDAGEVLDDEARRAYRDCHRERYEELAGERDEARRNNDSGRLEKAQHELEALAGELVTAGALGGRVRRACDDRDRLRKAVGNAIRRVVTEIGDDDKAFATHLSPPRLTCGASPCYRPGQPITWEL